MDLALDKKGDRDVIIYARLWAHIDSHMCAYTLTHTLLLDQLSAASLSYSEGQHAFSENNNRLKKKRAANFEVHICGIHWCIKGLLPLLNTVLVSSSNKQQGLFSIVSGHCQMKVVKEPLFFFLCVVDYQ